MSKFKTSIPVDVESVKQLLPAGHYLHGVVWDGERNAVDVVWEHDDLKTGRDFPVDYPREQLAKPASPESRVPSPESPGLESSADVAVPTEMEPPVEKSRRRK